MKRLDMLSVVAALSLMLASRAIDAAQDVDIISLFAAADALRQP